MSRCLTQRSIDHVVLERGEVANSWKTERWESLRLLTPNWQTRLPGQAYQGPAPDDFMTMREVIEFMEAYARQIDAPIRTSTTVISLRRADGGYDICTDSGTWRCRAVVIATGACNVSVVPRIAHGFPSGITSI